MTLTDLGLPSARPGKHRVTCPRCSSTRAKPRERCLAVTVYADGGFDWWCYHCRWNPEDETPDWLIARDGRAA